MATEEDTRVSLPLWAQTPAQTLVTDNLDNFSNRGDSHPLSTPSAPQDKATLTLSLAPTLPALRLSRLPKLLVTEEAPVEVMCSEG
jgi:hypothetical protein